MSISLPQINTEPSSQSISPPSSRSTSKSPILQSIIKTYDNRKPIKLKDPRRKMTKDEFFKLFDPKTKIENKKFNDERTFGLIATGYNTDLKSRNPIIATIAKINPKYPVYDIAKKRNKVAENIQFYFFLDSGHCPFKETQISVFITYYTLYAEVILGDDLDIDSRRKIFDLLTQDIDKNSNGNKMSSRDIKYKLNRIMKEILEIRNHILGTTYGANLFKNNNNGTGSNNQLQHSAALAALVAPPAANRQQNQQQRPVASSETPLSPASSATKSASVTISAPSSRKPVAKASAPAKPAAATKPVAPAAAPVATTSKQTHAATAKPAAKPISSTTLASPAPSATKSASVTISAPSSRKPVAKASAPAKPAAATKPVAKAAAPVATTSKQTHAPSTKPVVTEKSATARKSSKIQASTAKLATATTSSTIPASRAPSGTKSAPSTKTAAPAAAPAAASAAAASAATQAAPVAPSTTITKPQVTISQTSSQSLSLRGLEGPVRMHYKREQLKNINDKIKKAKGIYDRIKIDTSQDQNAISKYISLLELLEHKKESAKSWQENEYINNNIEEINNEIRKLGFPNYT